MQIRVKNIDHIKQAAKEFINYIRDNKVFAFYGQMGAGKTTFIKAICQELGVDNDSINSPTLLLINILDIRREVFIISIFTELMISLKHTILDMKIIFTAIRFVLLSGQKKLKKYCLKILPS